VNVAHVVSAQHVYNGHKIYWNEARILQIKPNNIYRKYKESAHMSLLVNHVQIYLLSGALSSARRLKGYNTAAFNVS
jgi:hypothetical protein